MLIIILLWEANRFMLKKNFSDGTIKSNKQSLKDIADGSTVQLDVPNQLNQDTAQQLLNTAFENFLFMLVINKTQQI